MYLKGFGGEEDGLSCNIRNEPMIEASGGGRNVVMRNDVSFRMCS